ncbi:hypothetical protein JTE90_013764 [Oedothorax gibbosus]|uniref:Proline-rich protein PRCC n=1 Tax=Oedothorax gibbosus TaxID=931172 RepID=A0AAV6V070_9ARAC|nr:hypothetical protein JTE90_013764 [Oedothorax gibbosus]
MALVAYGSSDSESDHEEEDTTTTNVPILPVPKKSRETVKITIPSLQEFKDEEAEPQHKKLKSKTGSGLFSMLPPPKHSGSDTTRNFKPYVLTKKKETKTTTTTVKPSKKELDEPGLSADSDPDISLNKNKINSAPVVDYFSLEDSSNKYDLPVVQSDNVLFSSLPKPAQSTDSFIPSSSHGVTSSSHELSSYSNEEFDTNYAQQNWDENDHETDCQPSAEPSFLNDEGFKKIKGRRDLGNIDIIDVNAGDQLTGKDQWLMQNLTEEKVQRPSKRRHDMPTQQQKRKHQITYLAFQAKERELDLKNQWSLNNRTRRETQAKYGF